MVLKKIKRQQKKVFFCVSDKTYLTLQNVKQLAKKHGYQLEIDDELEKVLVKLLEKAEQQLLEEQQLE